MKHQTFKTYRAHLKTEYTGIGKFCALIPKKYIPYRKIPSIQHLETESSSFLSYRYFTYDYAKASTPVKDMRCLGARMHVSHQ